MSVSVRHLAPTSEAADPDRGRSGESLCICAELEATYLSQTCSWVAAGPDDSK